MGERWKVAVVFVLLVFLCLLAVAFFGVVTFRVQAQAAIDFGIILKAPTKVPFTSPGGTRAMFLEG